MALCSAPSIGSSALRPMLSPQCLTARRDAPHGSRREESFQETRRLGDGFLRETIPDHWREAPVERGGLGPPQVARRRPVLAPTKSCMAGRPLPPDRSPAPRYSGTPGDRASAIAV